MWYRPVWAPDLDWQKGAASRAILHGSPPRVRFRLRRRAVSSQPPFIRRLCRPQQPESRLMAAAAKRSTFQLVLIKPTHYDDDGYPITWLRSHIPSNTLAALYGLAEDCRKRQVL